LRLRGFPVRGPRDDRLGKAWGGNFHVSPTGNINMRPVIDGQSLIGDQLDRAVGDFSGQRDILPFTRLYRLPAGLHTFGIEMTCQAGISVFNGWMTVYELPSVKLK
jgi:hypothetical protein